MGERIEALRIVTRCKSVAELVEAFEPYVEDDTCFIPNRHARPVGTEIAFSIRLADNTTMLRGTGTVREMWTDDQNPFGRPGMRLAISRIAPQSRALYERMRTRGVPTAAPVEKAERVRRNIQTVRDFSLESEDKPRKRKQPRAGRGSMEPLTKPGVPIMIMEGGSSTAVAVAPLIWRWWLAVVAFVLVVVCALHFFA